MVRVMKSPNMMSTMGRSPVIAAPTASPVNPASEIGVSSTRSLPNSSTRPESTLKGAPASATSSPRMQTVGSRRISSASASRIACPKVSSRSVVSGIDILFHLIDTWIGRGNRELHGFPHFGLKLTVPAIERPGIGQFLFDQPIPQIENRIPLTLPGLLFLLRAIVFAVDITHVMPVVPVCVAEQERGAVTATGALNQPLRDVIDSAHVLTVHGGGFQAEGSRPRQDVARRRFAVVRVFRVEIVLANVDHGKFEKLSKVHHLVQNALSQSTFSEEADRHLARAQTLGGKCCSGRDAGTPAHNRVGAQVAGRRVCNVHGASLALAVPGFFPQQFGEHSVGGGAFRQTMSMAAMRAGDVVGPMQRLADPDRDGYFPNIKVGKTRHQGAGVEFVDLGFKQTDSQHLAVHPEP